MWKRTTILTAVIAVLGLMAASPGALAERPPNSGPPVDEGNEPPDYGDLFILYRDPGGLPILTADGCGQPVSEDVWEGCATVPDGEHVGKCLVPVDPDTCGVIGEYAIYTEEVDFGRINEARSSVDVFEAQLNEVILNLATAGCIDLDPAGRVVYSSLTEDGTVSATTDSPLQQLAMYRQLVMFGELSESIELPDDPLHMAARAAGGALDKYGEATVDLFVYLNQILGLTEEASPSILPRVCMPIKQEVQGVIKMVNTCFLDYSAFTYERLATFAALPDRPYVPSMEAAEEGWFEYLAPIAGTDPQMFTIEQGPITAAVFGSEPGFIAGNIGGFTQEADDARAIIQYMHQWPVPEEFESQLTCDVAADIYYDVSISADSGLQVPVRMVAGTEGREGTVTVANAGPAEATGTVMVIGVYTDAQGHEQTVSMVRMGDGVPTEEPIFAEPEEFTLLPGRTQSWVFYFSMEEPTTIYWTATAYAELDVAEANNTVTEKTIVSKPKGGGSGGH